MAEPVAGEIYVLTHQAGIGQGPGALMFGIEVTVEGVYDTGTPGLGDHSEEGHTKVVRIEWTEPGMVQLGIDEKGNVQPPQMGEYHRAISVGLADFQELFEKKG